MSTIAPASKLIFARLLVVGGAAIPATRVRVAPSAA